MYVIFIRIDSNIFETKAFYANHNQIRNQQLDYVGIHLF